MTYTMSKALRAKITSVVPMTVRVGASSGTVMRKKTCISVAPSTRAASSNSGGMPFSAAEVMTMAKPVQTQTAAKIRAKLLTRWSMVQAIGSWRKTAVQTAFTVPVCGAPGGWYEYMNFQITPAATKEIAIGMKIRDLTALS